MFIVTERSECGGLQLKKNDIFFRSIGDSTAI